MTTAALNWRLAVSGEVTQVATVKAINRACFEKNALSWLFIYIQIKCFRVKAT